MEESGQVSYWVHDLDPVIIQFTDTLAVRWYGLAYVAGFLVAFALLGLYWKKGRSQLSPQMLESMGMTMILGVMIGGRLGYFLLYEFSTFIANPLVFFKVWEGGMASHGGFAGVAVAALLTARKFKLHLLMLGDLVASVSAAGLFFGRVANFINGELWGKVTDVSWAVIFPASAPVGLPVQLIPPRHPSQLYEALLEGLFLFIYMQARFWMVKGREDPTKVGSPSSRPGHLTGEFLVFYSIGRWIAELFREPDAALIMGINRGSFYSLFLLIAGIFFIAWSRRSKLTNGQIG
ncbi:prolipoprotein diacylglyceryl transferase [Puniceicoccales bacterium CK1056]|uniref:Phosphatidylglycerol--prolipoprotein diacylglyceryl transferase n=1 Tax=Oceanipulchritudo coccoides TaxID=2706888 RepID=A0A6B2M271_9BACT|nr:prolipoprotein diacylglyceryl transferase [Oceanipulchritudo coccoides]NDV61895.1 prolipoprotein diacylglyceryl transferase [Oceanipulchritudo coccoides]